MVDIEFLCSFAFTDPAPFQMDIISQSPGSSSIIFVTRYIYTIRLRDRSQLSVHNTDTSFINTKKLVDCSPMTALAMNCGPHMDMRKPITGACWPYECVPTLGKTVLATHSPDKLEEPVVRRVNFRKLTRQDHSSDIEDWKEQC